MICTVNLLATIVWRLKRLPFSSLVCPARSKLSCCRHFPDRNRRRRNDTETCDVRSYATSIAALDTTLSDLKHALGTI